MDGALFGTLPVTASKVAAQWDALYIFLFVVSIVFFLIVMVPLVVFSIKYRHKPGRKATYISHNTKLEVIWTVVPTIILMVIFAWGWIVYRDMITIPENAMEVRVVAQRWKWSFQYEDGRVTENQLFVPKGKPIKLTMTAPKDDVLHSFFIPNLRIKQDVVPGLYTYLNFTTDFVGQHQVFCAEYCGTNHSAMLAKVIVLDDDQWQLWNWGKEFAEDQLPPPVGLGSMASLKSKDINKGAPTKKLDLVQQGLHLSNTRGCMACHSADGSKKIGPSYKGIYGSKENLKDGSIALVDDNYLRESIENPQAKIVRGYENAVMPTYEGQLTSEEVNALIAYIKSLKD